jgi:hypothetical protein
MRNDALNAYDFFSNVVGALRNVLNHPRFWAMVGRAILVQKIFDA